MPAQASLPAIRRALAIFAIQNLNTEVISERAWRAKLEQPTPTLTIGRFNIHADESADVENQINIRLAAGLAFGTGEHETTALCLEWLSRQSLANSNVLDLGCGSAILAIAAAKLGAKSVTAIDIDPVALDVAKGNARCNGVEIEFSDQLATTANYQLIVANVFATELIKLAQPLQAVLTKQGALALSGILVGQTEEVMNPYTEIRFERPVIRNGWALLTGTKR